MRAAAAAVKQDFIDRPTTPGEGIWRFDQAIERVIDPKGRTKEFWVELRDLACRVNKGKETWDRDGFGIVSSYAGNKAAYATPGFTEAKRLQGLYWGAG